MSIRISPYLTTKKSSESKRFRAFFYLGLLEMGGIEPPSEKATQLRLQVYRCEVVVGKR